MSRIDDEVVGYTLGYNDGYDDGYGKGGIQYTIGKGGLFLVAPLSIPYTDLTVRYPVENTNIITAFDAMCENANRGKNISATVSYEIGDKRATAFLTIQVGKHIRLEIKALSCDDFLLDRTVNINYAMYVDGERYTSGVMGYVTPLNGYWDMRIKEYTLNDNINFYSLNYSRDREMQIIESPSYYLIEGSFKDERGSLNGRLTSKGTTSRWHPYNCMSLVNPNQMTEEERAYSKIQPILLDGVPTDFLVSYHRCSQDEGKLYFAKEIGQSNGLLYYYYGSVGSTYAMIPLDWSELYARKVDEYMAEQIQIEQTV